MAVFSANCKEAMAGVTATLHTSPDGPSIASIPDEVLILVLEAHPSRCEVRNVARRCRAIVECNFAIRKVVPPAGQAFCVDLEVNRHMTKHLYCARFGGNAAGEEGGVAGAVCFADWKPPRYRRWPDISAGVRHRIGERDACALWKTLVKVRDQRTVAKQRQAPTEPGRGVGLGGPGHLGRQRADLGTWADRGQSVEPEACFLTITEGGLGTCADNEDSRRDIIGKLSRLESDLVLQVLDYRRNAAAFSLCASPKGLLTPQTATGGGFAQCSGSNVCPDEATPGAVRIRSRSARRGQRRVPPSIGSTCTLPSRHWALRSSSLPPAS